MQAGYENEWVRMGTYEFIVSVVVWERVLVATNKASVKLQSVEMDLCHVLKFSVHGTG